MFAPAPPLVKSVAIVTEALTLGDAVGQLRNPGDLAGLHRSFWTMQSLSSGDISETTQTYRFERDCFVITATVN